MRLGEGAWLLFSAYLLTQALLLPLCAYLWRLYRSSCRGELLWRLQRMAACLSLLGPLLLLLPLPTPSIFLPVVRGASVIEILRHGETPGQSQDAAGLPDGEARSLRGSAGEGAGGTPDKSAEYRGEMEASSETTASGYSLARMWRPGLGMLQLVFSASGIVLFFIRQLLLRSSMRKLMRGATDVQKTSGIPVAASPLIRFPFCAGAIRPRIFLPQSVHQDPRLRETVVAHELTHVRSGHLLWSALDRFLLHCFWYNPLAHALCRLGYSVRELDCYRSMARKEGALEYCGAILAASELRESGAGSAPAAWMRYVPVRKRIDALLNPPRGDPRRQRAFGLTLVALTLLLTLGIASCSGRKAPGTTPGPAQTSTAALKAWRTANVPVKGMEVSVRAPANGNVTESLADASAMDVVINLPHRLPMLRSVYQQWLLSDDTLRGDLALHLAVAADGRVTQAEATSQDIANTGFLTAIANVAKGWTLREMSAPVELALTVPLRLGMIPSALSLPQYSYVETLKGDTGSYLRRVYARMLPAGAHSSPIRSVGLSADLTPGDYPEIWRNLVQAGMDSFFTLEVPGLDMVLAQRRPSPLLLTGLIMTPTRNPWLAIGSPDVTNAPAQGSILLSLRFAPDGSVTKAALVDTDIGDRAFVNALVSNAQQWRYSREQAKEALEVGGRPPLSDAELALGDGAYIVSMHYRRSAFPAYSIFRVGVDSFFEMKFGNGSSMSPIRSNVP